MKKFKLENLEYLKDIKARRLPTPGKMGHKFVALDELGRVVPRCTGRTAGKTHRHWRRIYRTI